MNTETKMNRRTRRLEFAFKFFTALARVTRFSLHGFVLWRIRKIYTAIIDHNMQVTAYIKQRRKERKRKMAEAKVSR